MWIWVDPDWKQCGSGWIRILPIENNVDLGGSGSHPLKTMWIWVDPDPTHWKQCGSGWIRIQDSLLLSSLLIRRLRSTFGPGIQISQQWQRTNIPFPFILFFLSYIWLSPYMHSKDLKWSLFLSLKSRVMASFRCTKCIHLCTVCALCTQEKTGLGCMLAWSSKIKITSDP